MDKPTDESKRGPLAHLEAASPGGIEASEARGQAELVASNSLPLDCTEDEELVSLGFELGEPFADDPIFRPAKLPEGWTREASEHAMWSYLLDAEGKRRVAIFYKAAFYDRRAFMRIERG